MNLEAEKLKLVKMILDIDSETTINKLKAFIGHETDNTDFWDELHDDLKAEVEEAIRQADAGMAIPHSEVVKEYSKWLKK